MRLTVIRAARDQIPECADGLVVTSRLPEDNAEREARFRQLRIECNGLSQRRFGAGEIILLFQRHTQVVMNLCGRRLEFRCIPQRSGGLIEPARLHQRRAEIQAGCRVRGLLFHQLTERCDRKTASPFCINARPRLFRASADDGLIFTAASSASMAPSTSPAS